MIERLNFEDEEVIKNTNFLRRSDVFYPVLNFLMIGLIVLILLSPMFRPRKSIRVPDPKKVETLEKWNPPSTIAEYFTGFTRIDNLVYILVTLPIFSIVLINWLIKKIDLINGTKEVVRVKTLFKISTKFFKVIVFWPIQIILYKRDGRLINLHKGDLIIMERTFLKRMIRFEKVSV
ncbi:MAG: hypothetical protein WDN75_17700 [Bacteroidota bacterium]